MLYSFRLSLLKTLSPKSILILAPAALMAPVVLAGKALYWGTPAMQFHPWRVFAWESLRSGRLPLWNPLLGTGAPLLANYQSAIFYPPNWIYFLLAALGGEAAMAWGMGLLVSLHLIWAALGMSRLVRSLGLGVAAQLVAGLSFSLSGYLVARAGFLSINAAVAWLPWVLWAGFRWVRAVQRPVPRRSIRRSVQLVLMIAFQLLAGHAQTTWYTLLLLFAWLLFWALVPRGPRGSPAGPAGARPTAKRPDDRAGSRRRPAITAVVPAGSLGIVLASAGLAAIQLLPTAELLLQSQRSGGADLDFVMTYSFWPWRFLTYLSPDFFGSPVHGDYWGYANYWEDAVYIGFLPFLLALRAILRMRSHAFRALIGFLVALTIVAFLLALGKNTPLFPFLYRSVPTFDLFQAPTRYTIWATFALSLLAAVGTESWSGPSDRRGRRWLGRGIAAAFAVLVAALAVQQLVPGVEPTFSRAAARLGLFGIGAGLLARFAPPALPAGRDGWTWILGSFVCLDLLLAGWGLNPGVELDFYRSRSAFAGQVRAGVGDHGRLYLSQADEYTLTFDRFFRFESFEGDPSGLLDSMLPNLAVLHGIRSANNFDPLLPARYVRWMDTLEKAEPDRKGQMLASMSVAVVQRLDPGQPAGFQFELLPRSENRFRWSDCAWLASSPETAWQRATEPRPPAYAGMLILENYGSDAEWLCGGDRSSQAQAVIQLVMEQPDQLKFEVDADAPGWLLVADAWYPGWRAQVDGSPVPVYAADYLYRAVPTPAGSSQVRLYYRPGSFWLGAGITALTALGMLFAYLRSGIWRADRG